MRQSSVIGFGSVCLGTAFGLSIAVCFAQTKQTGTPASHMQVACGTSKGCSTFNEMLRNNDPELRDLRDPSNTFFVCFSEEKGADSFFVIGFRKPQWTTSDANRALETSTGFFTFTDYLNGLTNRDESHVLMWNRMASKLIPGTDVGFAELAVKQDGHVVSIDGAELEYFTTFSNVGEQKVEYTVRVRRSTKRFQETLKIGGVTRTTSGRCVTF